MTAADTREPTLDAPLARLAGRTAQLTGWRRLALAALLGASTALALPPVYLVPLLVPAVVGLLWLTSGTTRVRAAFWVGWAFGLGHFAAGLYWIGIAFFVDAARYAWMMPFAVLGLAAGLAIYKGLMLAALRALPLWDRPSGTAQGVARVLALAAVWTLAEWLRGQLLTGFPWNLAATVWGFWPAAQQAAALIGAWGLSLLTVLAAGLPALLGWAGGRRGAWASVAAALGIIVLLGGGGILRLQAAPPPGAQVHDGIRLRLVQPGIPQHLKWRDDLRLAHVRKHIDLSRRAGFDSRTHVIWPETAVPYFLSRQPELRRLLARAAPEGGALLTGAPRVTQQDDRRVYHNSLLALGADGRELAAYDKVHLVPFGEYVPLRQYLPFPKLTQGSTDFTPGRRKTTLDIPSLPPFSALICYEVIFPQEVTTSGTQPAWLLNITNDAWFGVSSGPYQHLASARLRAIEQGLPLVRAANTGISVIVDPWGRTLRQLGLQKVGILDGPLPQAIAGGTFYARFGDLIAGFLVLIVLGIALLLRRF
ncbi:apolipoprotein N-acyltransferase [Rhodovibrio salinarum]|uniref:Apolipoprotein N-acyltransferase n=1 Tax=Rhodovibrio salinarum TaxID=1087 RepID=A0A934UZ52_9PROT|nr:apolipoprotein N-acyltransferase [Rhodovibrio salinarum]MBK1696792.1 apolipoprotein N-acyltransferase [Rhodovibrio salinarum]